MASNWRRFEFFDEASIPQHAAPPHAVHSAAGPGALVYACEDGWVQILDRNLQVVRAFLAHGRKAHYVRVLRHRPMLLTVGEDEDTSAKSFICTLRVKVWDLDAPPGQELNPLPTPFFEFKVVAPATPDPPGYTKIRSVSAVELSPDAVTVAVGLNNGAILMVQRVYTHRASSVRWRIDVPPSPRYAGPGLTKGESRGNEIAFLGFNECELSLPGGASQPSPPSPLRLFVVTDGQTLSFGASREGQDDLVILELKGAASAELCAVRGSQGGDLVVVREDAIALYDAELRKDSVPLEGRKACCAALGSYVALLQLPQTATAATEARQNGGGEAELGESEALQVTIFDLTHKMIAASFALPCVPPTVGGAASSSSLHPNPQQPPGPRRLAAVSGWNAFVVIPSSPGGAACVLTERPLQLQLEVLQSRELYVLAADVARTRGGDEALLADIARKYADFLYEKGDYPAAAEQYARTIRFLEASYVVRRFLDLQKIGCLVTYLEALQDRGLVGPDHCNLLLQCYTLLRSTEHLERLVADSVDKWKRGVATGIEPSAAIQVLRRASFPELALQLAEAVGDHFYALEILLQDLSDPARALRYLQSLPPATAVPSVLQFGRQLVTVLPQQMTVLIAQLCTAVQDGPGSKARPPAARYPDFVPLFTHHPESLLLFCEYILHTHEAGSPSPKDIEWEAPLRRTLLELYLSNDLSSSTAAAAAAETAASATASPPPPATPDTAAGSHRAKDAETPSTSGRSGSAPPPPPPLAKRSRALDLLKSGWAPGQEPRYDRDEMLVLCQMRGFLPGVQFLYERMGRPHDALRCMMENGDLDAILEACQRYDDVSLWEDMLAFLARQPGDCSRHILKVLQRLQGQEFDPLGVLRAIAPHPVLQLGQLRPFIEKNVSAELKRIQEDAQAVGKLEDSVRTLRAELEALGTQPRVFQSLICAQTQAPLELPTVHFLCGHSFNQRSLGQGDAECPKCAKKHDSVLRIYSSIQQQKPVVGPGPSGGIRSGGASAADLQQGTAKAAKAMPSASASSAAAAGTGKLDRFFSELRTSTDGYGFLMDAIARGSLHRLQAFEPNAAGIDLGLVGLQGQL